MKRINSVILFYRSNRINDGVGQGHKQESLASCWHQFQQYPSNTHTLTTVNNKTTGFITSIWTRSSKSLELFKLCITTRNNDAN